MPSARPSCHVCGSACLEPVRGLEKFRRITSDCQPFKEGRGIFLCPECGAIQKAVDECFFSEIEEIYAAYAIYEQSQGQEQAVFDQGSGQAMSRSAKVLSFCEGRAEVAGAGRMLDVGCGNGAMLRAFAKTRPGFRLAGTEFSSKYKAVVEAIPGVEALYTCALKDIPGSFDFVSMIHVIEHIPNPVAFMREVWEKLAPGGLLLLEAPHALDNPFDLCIADHCTHFTLESARYVLEAAGFELIDATTGWIFKEITLLARKAGQKPRPAPQNACAGPSGRLDEHCRWLENLRAKAMELGAAGELGVFGTSIAAVWLASQLEGEISFFVDEDISRVGKNWLGKPVFNPSGAPAGANVLIALPLSVASQIKARLDAAGLGCKLVLPPDPANV